jgi:hypothetical protein
MKLGSNNSLILGLLAIAAIGVGFWMLVLSPKREEAKQLGTEIERLEASLAQHEAEVAAGEEARGEFAAAYRQLVVLGKAVPGDDETASLLVQLNAIAERAKVRFSEFALNGTGESAPEAAPTTTAADQVTPTEAAASVLPLGASIGPAGLAVMPYTLAFEGGFFRLANFIKGLDSLVKTTNEKVAVDGRLITIGGFALSSDPDKGFPTLEGDFEITTYLTPPDEGATGGATPAGPSTATAAPAATTTGATP